MCLPRRARHPQGVVLLVFCAWGALSWFICVYGVTAHALNPPKEVGRFVVGLLVSIAFSLLRDWLNVAAAALGAALPAPAVAWLAGTGRRGAEEGWLEEVADSVSVAEVSAGEWARICGKACCCG